LCPVYNLQKYEEGEGFFSLHNEQSGSYPYRLLAWMVYLNDATSGTEFPYQEMTVTPKEGRTVIWPAGWTHPHKGVTPNKGTKYIATGWFYTLPMGEPKFDGRHPDEENITEILV
jgi:prolyl 4-hydroxylase